VRRKGEGRIGGNLLSRAHGQCVDRLPTRVRSGQITRDSENTIHRTAMQNLCTSGGRFTRRQRFGTSARRALSVQWQASATQIGVLLDIHSSW